VDNTDDPDERDLRRRLLAKRMVSHRARTQTIWQFTGISRDRLETLRRRWGVPSQDRRRGPSPTSIHEFFRNARCHQMATTAALFCQLLGVLPKHGTGSLGRPISLEAGELVCSVYEALHTCFPEAHIEFEQLVLLARGLAEGSVLQLGLCQRCGAAILIDRLAAQRAVCRPDCVNS